MSNNIYNILNNFNKVAQEPQKPATQEQPKSKTQLQESMEQVLARKLIAEKKKGDGNLANNAKPYDKVTRGDVIAGRLGKDEMGGKKMKEGKFGGSSSLRGSLKNLSPGQNAVVNAAAGYVALTQAQKLAQMAKSSMAPDNAPTSAGAGQSTSEFSATDPRRVDTGADVNETDYSAKKARAGKDIGKPGKNFAKIAKGAAERYGSKERGEKVAGAVLAKLRAKESVNEMDKSQPSSDRGGESSGNPYAKGGKATPAKAKDVAKSAGKALNKAMDSAHKKPVKEVAPPGEKAERMVKHIKKGYAKDGKITPKEKSIAYATAWKAHNKGKVEEAIRAMMEAGFTKEQIVEGWDEMMKAVKDRAHGMKTGEKRAGAKGEIEKTSHGVKHTRRYDPKTGETETGSDGEQVKRGRGRPKKSAFESKQLIKKMIAEAFTGFFEGSIQGGVWTANKGNVPVPQNPEVAAPTKMGTAAVAPKTGIAGQAAQDLMKSSDPNIYNKLTGQKTPAKLTPAVTDPEGVKEDDMEEGNYFSGQLAKARAAGKKQADLDGDGDMEQVREEEDLDESKCMECGMYESKCKCDKVEESLNLFRKLAGLQECMSPISGAAQEMQDSQGKMNINTNMSSDGHKSVTITADGDAAGELMQMLKLAGMGGAEGGEEAHVHAEPEGVMVVTGGEEEGGEEEVDEAKDERYHANTTPEEHVMPTQVQTKGGDGDVAGEEKRMHKHGYKFSDNPLAMQESASLKLIKEYEGIKVKK